MSAIKTKIEEDIKTAMKAREQHLLLTLRSLMAAVKQVEVDSRKDVEDGDVLAVLQKEVKKRKEALQYAEKEQRDDLIAQNKAEVAMLQKYLGEQISEADLRKIIGELVAGGADAIGKVMGALNKEHKGKFDGKLASEICRSMLG